MNKIIITTPNGVYTVKAKMTAETWQKCHEEALIGLGDATAESAYGFTHVVHDPEIGYHFVHLRGEEWTRHNIAPEGDET